MEAWTRCFSRGCKWVLVLRFSTLEREVREASLRREHWCQDLQKEKKPGILRYPKALRTVIWFLGLPKFGVSSGDRKGVSVWSVQGWAWWDNAVDVSDPLGHRECIFHPKSMGNHCWVEIEKWHCAVYVLKSSGWYRRENGLGGVPVRKVGAEEVGNLRGSYCNCPDQTRAWRWWWKDADGVDVDFGDYTDRT